MTNIRLRIEDAGPAMTTGYFGVTYFTGAASIASRGSRNGKFLIRNGRTIPMSAETG